MQMEETKRSVLARDIRVAYVHQTPLSSMNLSELCSTKVRVLQRLENNRLGYSLIRVGKVGIFGEEEGKLAINRGRFGYSKFITR